MGSELVGESFVLFVSAGIIIYEYQRSKLKELEKAEKLNAIATKERYELQQQLNTIHTRIETMEQSLIILLQQQMQQEQQEPTTATATTTANSHETNGNLLDLLYWWRRK